MLKKYCLNWDWWECAVEGYEKDDGRPVEIGYRELISNCPNAAFVKSIGRERLGKSRVATRKVWNRKTSKPEPLLTRRKPR